jgi:RNA polymerase sigma-70 factor (ECF subfamily)
MKNDSDQLLATRWTLIERLKNWDDQESWRQFFDSYWKLIYGVAIKSGLTHPEAQDVVQETVISVSKSMQNFKADPAYGSFKAWLLNLTRWRITDQFRKRRAAVNTREETPTSGSESSERDTTPTAVAELVPDPAGNALEVIWNDEWEKHIVDAALEKVKQQSSAKHYQIFFLQAIKQIPPAKIAETLNLKVDQVYLIKHRLTNIFEEALKELETKLG